MLALERQPTVEGKCLLFHYCVNIIISKYL